MSLDSSFGFILMVGQNMSTHILVLCICTFPTTSKPSKHTLIVMSSDFAACRGKILDATKSATKCAKMQNSAMQHKKVQNSKKKV